MAEMLIISSVLPPIVEKATSLLLDRALNQYDIMVNIQRDIRNLKTTLNKVNGILQEAEERQIDNNNVRELLRELVDVCYEARDLLDDFFTYATRRTSSVKFDCFRISSFFSCFGTRFQLANGIKSVMERLDEIMEQSDIVDISESLRKGGSKSESASRSRPKTSFYVNRQRDLFVGRELEKDEIIRKLVRHDGNGVLVVPILGGGGLGKTTLAQFVYNDERVKEEDYPIFNRKWLFVGEKKFNAQEIIERIIGESNHPDFVVIQKKLVENFKGNKFLIVLDDVWNLDSNEWKLLFDPLTNVGKGGVIIITTRIREVISATNTQVPTDLRPLSPEGCWKIFESYAFVDGKSSNRPEMEPIGREIVEELDGLPLAAQVVGSSLLNEPDATWSDFINNWEWNLRNNDNEIMAALRWSYKLLPPHLKHCFAYCALFPKDHVFDEKVLVEMWMAHDLIQINGHGRPEDIGIQYFKELTYASLFQFVDERYVMHDMIHDLALHVSNEEFSGAVSSLLTDQMKKVRHITITNDDEYSKNLSLCKSKRILTFYTPYKWHERSINLKKDIFLEVFKQSKSLRVLVLSQAEITEIPDCISELRHLRYLDVSETRVKSLPDSLCHLYNLQMLAAPHYAVLPRDIVNMVNLRHVRANLSTCKGVGKLTSLQELSSIHVSKGDNIRELGDMQLLRGELTIKGLENVSTLEGDVGALMEKQTLMDELELVFNQDLRKSTISEQVLDALGCPPNLTYLRIDDYIGLKPPSWMVDGKHKFDKLQTLNLHDCPKLESLPPLGELTSLKYLSLWNVGIKRLGDEFYGKFTDSKVFFPSLESLSFSYMLEWKEWDDIIIENSSVSFFPRLTTLEIFACWKLVTILSTVSNAAGFMKSLSSLKISQCYYLISCLPIVKKREDNEHPIMKDANFMTSLSRLEIRDCDGLKRLQFDALVSLKELKIKRCSSLVQITSAICESLEISSCRLLEKLDVARCDSLVVINILKLQDCESFRSLSIHIHGLDSFEHLDIRGCPKLELAFEDGSNSSSSSGNSVAVPIHRISTDSTQVFRTLSHHELVSLESLDITNLEGFENLGDNFCKSRLLKSLRIWQCKDLKSLPTDFHKLSSLSRLHIGYCQQLQSLPSDFHKLSSLKNLEIINSPKLQSLPRDFHKLSSLQSLSIYDCPQLQSLPPDFHKLSSLQSLSIYDCPQLQSLPPDFHKLSSLKKLSIIGCPQLQSLPADGFPPSLSGSKYSRLSIAVQTLQR